jgi:hypothetical protein
MFSKTIMNNEHRDRTLLAMGLHVCRTFCATTYRLQDVTRLVALRGVKLNWNETLFVLVKFCLGEVEGEVEHL